MSSMVGARNRCPFTGMQRQELEQQFIIFKHIISGLPIPPDLVSTVKKTGHLLQQQDSSSTLLPPHHQHSHQPIGWGCFQMGFRRKADAEPGRCRRTDGKKWRCSKEAHPDSKYCERHMHRGRNRSSTKPVAVDPSPSPSSLPKTLKPTISDVDNMSRHHPHHHLFLGSCADKTTYSCFEGVRDEAMEGGAFGAEGSISHQPSTRARSSASGYSQLEPKEEEKGKHCFVLGTDFKSVKIDRVEEEEEEEEEKHKPFHHFFGEWPPKSRDYYSWLDIEDNHQSSTQCYDGIGSFTTHLSISMPPSTQDLLFGSKSPNFHNEG